MTDIKALAEKLEGWSDVVRGTGRVALSADLDRAAAALRDLTEWRDIAAAPKDGTVVLGFWPFKSFDGHIITPVVRRSGGRWVQKWDHEEVHPTHWLPLPSAPNQAKEAGE